LWSNPEAKAVVFGCAGRTLSQDERRFFEAEHPFGFILFRRNIDEPAQVRDLVAALRDAVGRPDAPVLIDQEGGRVARLGPPHWPTLPPARAIGQLAEENLFFGRKSARALGRVIGTMLKDLGISIVCAPVADLLLPETHAVIGDRAFSDDGILAGVLAMAEAEGLRDAGVMPIVKHIPGHGRATADSHLTLPRIDADRETLRATDFAAFRLSVDIPWAMVAHCVYAAFDTSRPASTSPTVVAAIRGEIGYRGVLIADDINMKALQGSLAENAAATLAAGCDLTLHCSGDLQEMEQVAPAAAPLSRDATRRLQEAAAWLSQDRQAFDPAAELALLRPLLS
jgi:beta-N-acetylhexosaminidase